MLYEVITETKELRAARRRRPKGGDLAAERPGERRTVRAHVISGVV